MVNGAFATTKFYRKTKYIIFFILFAFYLHTYSKKLQLTFHVIFFFLKTNWQLLCYSGNFYEKITKGRRFIILNILCRHLS